MDVRWKRRIMLIAGVLLSAAALGFFVFKLRGHWRQVAGSLARANYLYVVPAVAFIAIMYALRIVRWRLFLKPLGQIPYRHITSSTLIGFMSTCVLPLRAGEIIRPYLLSRKTGLHFGHAAGTDLGLGRVFDIIGSCFLIFLALSLLPAAPGRNAAPAADSGTSAAQTVQAEDADGPDWQAQLRAQAPWLAGVALTGILGMLAVALKPDLMLRVLRFLLRPLPEAWAQALLKFSDSVIQSLGFLKNPGQFTAGVALTLAIWFCYPVSTWSLARGFGLELPFGGAVLVQVLITLAVALPQAPSFLGVFQVAAMAGVGLYGVDKGPAGAFATMLWIINVVPITVVGLGVLWWEGLSLRVLAEESREAAAETEE
ncbi:MAG: lysylphosphatidylglycerol synthase transmembrane domain-containing protein [Candidatus Brocadiia bacterium]